MSTGINGANCLRAIPGGLNRSDASLLTGRDGLPAGHWQAVAAMLALRSHADALLNALNDAYVAMENAKKDSKKLYAAAASNAEREFKESKKLFEAEFDANVRDAKEQSVQASQIVTVGRKFLDGITKKSANGTKRAANTGMDQVNRKNERLQKEIGNKIGLYETLRDTRIREAKDRKAILLKTEERKRDSRDLQAERVYAEQVKSLCRIHGADISAAFNRADLERYRRAVGPAEIRAETYECPLAVPAFVVLGEIGFSIPVRTREGLKVAELIDTQASAYAKQTKTEYTVQLPYAQRLEDGISMLIRYAPKNRDCVQNMLRQLLLKLYLSFPAGKLEATMIDPLASVGVFTDVIKLAERSNTSRNNDTRVWSREEDIEKAMSVLRQRLEYVSQAYGNNQASRLQKEALKALAISDFPIGFSDKALRDLHVIVRNSAALGVCVLIGADDEELKKLESRNGPLVKELMQSLVATEADRKKLKLLGDGMDRIFIRPDEMADVMKHKDEIFPYIGDMIEHTAGRPEDFEDLFRGSVYDSRNWFRGARGEIAVPIGVKGADTVVKMVLGRGGINIEHHALVAGQTGGGKSTFLHTLIMSTLVTYSPEDVQMYLLDFKEVEFIPYTRYRLPSFRTVAINSEREFGLSVLEELCEERDARIRAFSRYGVADINDYNAHKPPDAPKMPRLLLIFDEVQELFRRTDAGDSICGKCLDRIDRLVMQGRAFGIHLILASQDFRNCPGLEAFFSQMAVRVAVKGSEEGLSSILSADNTGVVTLRKEPAGTAIYNGGGGIDAANEFFRISMIRSDQQKKLLERLDAYYSAPAIAERYLDMQTRILLTYAEDDTRLCFNRLIEKGVRSIGRLGSSESGFGLALGLHYGDGSVFTPELRAAAGENLLIVGKDEKKALSLFEMSAMSILYEGLLVRKTNVSVYVFDQFQGTLNNRECGFAFLRQQFPQQIEIVKNDNAAETLERLYDTLIGRSEGTLPSDERIFILFCGIDRANALSDELYDREDESRRPSKMIRKILSEGGKYGINAVTWGRTVRGIKEKIGGSENKVFNKRIAYRLDPESMESLVEESDTDTLQGETAVYLDVASGCGNTRFRPYRIPEKEWVKRYAVCCGRALREGV